MRSRLRSPTHLSSQGLHRPQGDWFYFPGNGGTHKGLSGFGAGGPGVPREVGVGASSGSGAQPDTTPPGRPWMFVLPRLCAGLTAPGGSHGAKVEEEARTRGRGAAGKESRRREREAARGQPRGAHPGPGCGDQTEIPHPASSL